MGPWVAGAGDAPGLSGLGALGRSSHGAGAGLGGQGGAELGGLGTNFYRKTMVKPW